jgi:hypothetical protein
MAMSKSKVSNVAMNKNSLWHFLVRKTPIAPKVTVTQECHFVL